jgi:hypothetical protein
VPGHAKRVRVDLIGDPNAATTSQYLAGDSLELARSPHPRALAEAGPQVGRIASPLERGDPSRRLGRIVGWSDSALFGH